MILLARVYSPAAFGEFSLVIAIAAVISIIASLRLEAAIPLPSGEDDALQLARVALQADAIVGLVGGAVWGVAAQSEFIWGARVGQAALAAAFMAAVQVLNQVAIRRKRFTVIAVRNMILPVVMVLMQGIFLLTPASPLGLYLGYLASYILVFAWMFRDSQVDLNVNIGALDMLREYRHFPRDLGPAGLLNSLGQQLPLLIMSGYFSREVAGWFGLTQRALAMPVALVGTAIAQVYLARASECLRDDPRGLRRLFSDTSRRLIAFGVAVGVLVGTCSPWAFPLLLGDPWSEAGVYAAIWAPALTAQVVGASLSQTLIVLRKTRTQLAWDASRVGLLIAVAFGIRFGLTPRVGLVCLSGTLVFMYGVLWLINARAVRELPDRAEGLTPGPPGGHSVP
nr:oligosaccharide flippase family protein [Dermacoccus sp. Tok2021]